MPAAAASGKRLAVVTPTGTPTIDRVELRALQPDGSFPVVGVATGSDPILGFTRSMTFDGERIQFVGHGSGVPTLYELERSPTGAVRFDPWTAIDGLGDYIVATETFLVGSSLGGSPAFSPSVLASGTFCIGADPRRSVIPMVRTCATGFGVSVPLTALPVAGGTASAIDGETWWFQASASDGTVRALSSAFRVTIRL